MTLPTAETIHAWLSAHPDFFEQHPDLLASLQLPHPQSGEAVSLVEHQVRTLRERNRTLETRLADLIQIARDNDALSAKVQRFAVHVLRSSGSTARIDAVLEGLREGFRIPHVALRVWHPGLGRPGQAECQPVMDELRTFAEGLTQPMCGHHPVYEVNRWFGEDGPRLRSFALAPLGQPAQGLLVLASEDPERFYPEMGTAYVAQVAELVHAALASLSGDAPA